MLRRKSSLNDMENDEFSAYSLPPFANARNRAVAEQVKANEARLAKLQAQYEDHASRADAMAGHMRNVQQELQYIQGLYEAKNREIQSEEHFKSLAQRELGRLSVEQKRIEKDISQVSENITAIQTSIHRGNERVDTLRRELRIEREELDEWVRAQAEKEEDNQAILKYSKEDEARIRDLSLQIERAVAEVSRKKAQLSAEVTETRVAQLELDRATDSFRKLHSERQNLIQKWQDAIQEMQVRDEDITQAQVRHRESNEEVARKRALIDERRALLESQEQANSETEKKIFLTERSVVKLREQQQEASRALIEYRDEVNVLKGSLSKASADVYARRSEITQLKSEIEDGSARLSREVAHRDAAVAKMAEIKNKTMTIESKASEYATMLQAEESRSKELDKDIKTLRDQQFKRTQELHKMRTSEKALVAAIAGNEATLKNLKAKVHKLDQDALKQQSLLYAQEFAIQQLERRVRRAKGERSEEEREALNKRISELTATLEQQTKHSVLLNAQLKKAQEDVRHAKKKSEGLQKEKEVVLQGIDELTLYNDSAAQQLSQKVREKEDIMVEENLTRLELRRLRFLLSSRAETVFDLETRQLTLKLGLEERLSDIQSHTSILRARHRDVEEAKSKVMVELRERVAGIEKLKKRYDIVVNQMGNNEDGEAGETKTQAYYVIKAAQEREELQREGDTLDVSIRKMEREVRALENTLKLLNDRNDSYRNHVYKSEVDAKDVQHKQMLEQQYNAIMSQTRLCTMEADRIRSSLSELESKISELSKRETHLVSSTQHLETRLTSLRKDVDDLQARRTRASNQVVKMAKDLRKARDGEVRHDELDLAIRTGRDVLSVSVDAIVKAVEIHCGGDATRMMEHLRAEIALAAPSIPASRSTSRASSHADDTSSTNGSESGGTRPSSRASSYGMAPRRSVPTKKSTGKEPATTKGASRTDLDASMITPPQLPRASSLVGSTSKRPSVIQPGVSSRQGPGISSRATPVTSGRATPYATMLQAKKSSRSTSRVSSKPDDTSSSNQFEAGGSRPSSRASSHGMAPRRSAVKAHCGEDERVKLGGEVQDIRPLAACADG
ncbi:hypothetical protein SmJEL517_g05809 [Synchytrium microbalum]|uniref:Coiled-coil domain-containing protein 39 n=1 Tax=Synchytrium microbalum TaxID=1806994 RepID=A0A507BLV4_9FUNG|nr:uncharacterized protein SmJEL517_g05809 [Synchytrium microbalum]TPX30667.1 hypothetical protein SmJEL517_g05809 [Synchytrium microbalum]